MLFIFISPLTWTCRVCNKKKTIKLISTFTYSQDIINIVISFFARDGTNRANFFIITSHLSPSRHVNSLSRPQLKFQHRTERERVTNKINLNFFSIIFTQKKLFCWNKIFLHAVPVIVATTKKNYDSICKFFSFFRRCDWGQKLLKNFSFLAVKVFFSLPSSVIFLNGKNWIKLWASSLFLLHNW